MSGPSGLDSTQKSFPPYADLTQTQGWARPPTPIRADTNEAAEAVETSQRRRYEEGAVLGTGGMGKVMLARDARIGRDVALKVLHAERELDPEDRARFLREAQVQGQLEHPSIVPVYDIERRADGTTFFTMRRVQGRTLAAIIDDLRKGVPAAKTRYTQRELLTAFATVCLAVDYAHTRGVVHRDLKPANIMLGDYGEVYVLDWGLARLVDEAGEAVEEPHARLSMPGEFLGTPMYMAPEQMANPDVGPSADVYSLGLILFELLTLERARDPNALFAPVDARPSVRTPYRNVAPELESICVKAVEGDPKDRFTSPRALQEAINRYLEGDRETEQRRQLASQHVSAARAALARSTQQDADHEKERGVAMTELTRAVALDPTNSEHGAMLADIMANPPPNVPAAVEAQLDRENQRIMRLGATQSMIAMCLWVLMFPFLLALGFAASWQAALIAVPVGLTAALSFVMTRQKQVSWTTQYISIIVLMSAAAMVSRLFGPFILVPTIIATNSIVLQTHPLRAVRVYSAIVACVFMIGVIAIEWTGVLPSSYVFADGVWTIVPQLVELPRVPMFVFLTFVAVAMILVPSAFIARLRRDLNEAQVRLAVQAWHFRRLGAQLIGERV